MQTFENDTNCAEIVTQLTIFHTRLISYWHCHRIYSKYPPLNCILVSSQMRVPLVNCRKSRVLYLSIGHGSPTPSLRLCLVSLSGNTGVHTTKSNSPNLSRVAYTICIIINCRITSCVFKMLMNWKSICSSFVTDSAIITSGAFHKVA